MTQIFTGNHYRITVLTEQLLRLEYSESGYFEDGKTQMVVNRDFPKVEFDVIDDTDRLEIITSAFHLYYKKGSFSPQNLFIDTKNAFGGRWYYGEEYENLRGTASTLDGADGAIPLGEGVVSKNGFALLDDSDSFIFDEANEPIARPDQEIDLYFFGHGRDYFGALRDFYHLSGATPLLPRYALGNWWSRYWAYSEAGYLDLIDRFSDELVPLSVSVIDMDWHLVDIPERFGSGWTGYSWNKNLFPDPKNFMKKLHDKNLKVTLNVHPADGIRAFEDSYPQVAKRLGLDEAAEEPAIFDITNRIFREAYFKNVHNPMEADGVDFWWIDWQQGIKGKMLDVDPLWLLNYYHYKDINREKKNGVILSRYAGPGSHRYPIGFSGDTFITWASLRFQPYFTSTASNIGYTWWSHDIGGHYGGSRDEELAMRWIQLGVFSPINRLHSSNSMFTGKEPWNFRETICKSMESYLHLRHELLPYLYTMNVKTAEESKPLVLPMYYYYPLDEASYQVPNQYFFGSEFFVAPITEKTDPTYQTARVDAWFPEGLWFDFFGDGIYKGNTKLPIYRGVTEMPVFVKAGGIVPLDHEPAMTGTPLPETIDWHLFPGADNRFSLVEDENDKRVVTTLHLDWANAEVSLEVSGDTNILPNGRNHRLIFHHLAQTDLLLENVDQSVSFDKSGFVATDTKKLIFDLLNTAEISYNLKNDLWYQLQGDKEWSQKMVLLNQLEEGLRLWLSEILYIEESLK